MMPPSLPRAGLALALGLALAAVPAPALAADAPPRGAPSPAPDPLVAAALGLMPLAIVVPTALLGWRGGQTEIWGDPSRCNAPGEPPCDITIVRPAWAIDPGVALGVNLLAPMSLAAGYAYVGEPERGFQAVVGAYGVPLALGAAGFLLDNALGLGTSLGLEQPQYGFYRIFFTGVGLAAGLVGVSAWAAQDLHGLAQRRRATQVPFRAPDGGAPGDRPQGSGPSGSGPRGNRIPDVPT